MYKLVLVALVAILTSCGKETLVMGPQGPQGVQGEKGDPGVDGQDGVDATPVTVVKLCPNNSNSTYPNIYTEISFCLGGKLYATYSANGGFSTEIPPGTYSSNGINSSCTFKVKPNCVVEQL